MDFYKLTMLKEQLAYDARRLEELRHEAYSPSSPIVSDMPKSSGFAADGGKPARIVTDISEMEERVMDDKIRIVQEVKRLELLISDIPDSLIRVALSMRYISRKRWKDIHKELHIEGSVDALKKYCYRNLRE